MPHLLFLKSKSINSKMWKLWSNTINLFGGLWGTDNVSNKLLTSPSLYSLILLFITKMCLSFTTVKWNVKYNFRNILQFLNQYNKLLSLTDLGRRMPTAKPYQSMTFHVEFEPTDLKTRLGHIQMIGGIFCNLFKWNVNSNE